MPKIIIRKCDEYDKERLIRIFLEGMEILNLKSRIKGKITIKPNVVLAHPKVAPSAFTRPEFISALLSAFEKVKIDPLSFSIVENSGTGVPTSRMYKRAGYLKLKKMYNLKLRAFEESRKTRVKLKKGKVHSEITVQRDLIENDLLVYAPKLKTNVLASGMTASIKLNIGIIGDKERMMHHTYRLPEKIVDLLEIGYPDFIATDAIEIGMGGNQMTEYPLHLGAVIMSNHSLAHDMICAHILNLEPKKLPLLVEASQREYGSLELNDIDIDTDINLEELRRKTGERDIGFIRVENLDGPIRVLSGEPYCIGGCQGIMLDWLYMLKDRAPSTFNKKRDLTVVIGEYNGDVSSKRIILLGDCTKVNGRIEAKRISRIKGCPVRHKDLILHFFLKTFIRAPLMRLDLLIDAYPFLWLSHLKGWVRERIEH
ncbi:MAG: DUF362 domain-containing protein [Acidobacteriota bacterium]